MAYSTYITTSNKLRVTAGFPKYADGTPHRGGDVKVPGDTNKNVGSLVSGEVIRSEFGTGGNWSWGNFICVYSPERDETVLMAHFAQRLVNVGDTVKAGDIIGIYGSTGNVTGPHVHVERHKGRGITNHLLDPFVLIGVPNAVGDYDVTFEGSEEPPMPSDYKANILVVVFSKDGHVINAPASNDTKGYVYFYNGEFYRFKLGEFDSVEQYGDWKYWRPVTNVNILAMFNKDLTELPDV